MSQPEKKKSGKRPPPPLSSIEKQYEKWHAEKRAEVAAEISEEMKIRPPTTSTQKDEGTKAGAEEAVTTDDQPSVTLSSVEESTSVRRRFGGPGTLSDLAATVIPTKTFVRHDDDYDDNPPSTSRKLDAPDTEKPAKHRKRETTVGGSADEEPKEGATLSKKRKVSLWVTADIHRNVDHESYVIYALRDFCLYVLFLIVVSLMTFGVLDHAYNYYANVLSEILTNSKFNATIGVTKTYNEIRTVDQIWEFIDGVLLKVIYESNYDEKRSLSLMKPESVLVLFENIVVGAPRLRQVRVRNDSCLVPPLFGDVFKTCYGYYTDDNEGREPFGLGSESHSWQYHGEENSTTSYFPGKISTYAGGGYSMNITRDEAYTRGWIDELKRNKWIRQGTRAVFLDFTTYTPNTNLFCVVKLVLELPPTGGVIPSSHFYTMKFLRYVNVFDHIVLGCEFVFLGFVVYYTMEEVQEIMKLRAFYFDNFWNILDLAVLLISYITIACGFYRFSVIISRIDEKVNHITTDTHASFDDFVKVQMSFNTSLAILSFLVWIKLLKFAALNRSVALILTIFNKVKLELIALTLMMLTMILGFSLLGHILFGTHVEQFNTVWNSMFTLIGLFVGGLYFYKKCEEASPYLAPLFFIIYIFVVIILFLNAFVALIVHGFYKAVEEFEDQRDRVYFVDVCKRLRYNFLVCIRKQKYAEKLKDNEKARRNKRDYDALLAVLRRHGFRGLELALLLKKYDIVPGEPIPFDKMSEVYKDINARNQLYLEVEEHDKIMEQMEKINKKIEFLDQTLADILTKVDILVDKLLYQEVKGR